MKTRAAIIAVLVGLSATACGGTSGTTDSAPSTSSATVPATASDVDGGQRFPDVIDAVVTEAATGWDFDVTVSSPYDTPERYADAWRVVGPDGIVFGVRELLHDHADEQPFTRSLRGVEIPSDVDLVVVEGRDSSNGWGGRTVEVLLDRG